MRLIVFKNRLLRKAFGPKSAEATEHWRRLQSEEISDLYSSPNIILVPNQGELYRRDMWHVWGRGGMHRKFWYGNLRKRDHLKDLGIDGIIILKRS
jgi:hypothetical protein